MDSHWLKNSQQDENSPAKEYEDKINIVIYTY